MSEEPEAMREIHEIRERLWLEQKNMTPEECIRKTNTAAKEILRNLGFEALMVKDDEGKYRGN